MQHVAVQAGRGAREAQEVAGVQDEPLRDLARTDRRPEPLLGVGAQIEAPSEMGVRPKWDPLGSVSSSVLIRRQEGA